VLLFGLKYAGCGTLLAWLAIAQAVRTIRAVQVMLCMALGRYRTPMLINAIRVVWILGVIPVILLSLGWSTLQSLACLVSWQRLFTASAKQKGYTAYQPWLCVTPTLLCWVLCGLAGVARSPLMQ